MPAWLGGAFSVLIPVNSPTSPQISIASINMPWRWPAGAGLTSAKFMITMLASLQRVIALRLAAQMCARDSIHLADPTAMPT